LKETTKQFVGDIQQKPPIFSAIKKDGKRLYELARKGETTEIKARTVTVSHFEITKIDLPNVEVKIVCSKGTYIRSLAYDFGKALNSGAHLSALRRTKIGNFSVENASSIEDFIKNLEN
jgi:tRNA pseudouridine55 synthase